MKKQYFYLMAAVLLTTFVCGLIYKWKKADFPVDLVYTWVDGSDEVWQQKRDYWQQKLNRSEQYATSKARWRDRDELRHSLRSIEKYMPWVRKIFIVTDGQTPAWLDTDNPKIEVVDHKDIFPKDALPVFNSMAIETRLPFIKGLSEHFIYANDDVFANAPLPKSFFFDEKGRPVIYYEKLYDINELNRLEETYSDEMWPKLWKRPVVLVKQKQGVDVPLIVDTHTFAAFRKKDFFDALKMFDKEFEKTTYSKFRSDDDLTIGIGAMTDYNRDKTILRKNYDLPKELKCKRAGMLIMNNVNRRAIGQSCSFCLNDTHDLSNLAQTMQTQYMKKRFPNKSSFEK